MRISYLIPGFGRTGGSIVLYNFMDNLKKRNHDVYAIFPDKRIKWEIGEWKNGLKTYKTSFNDSIIKKISHMLSLDSLIKNKKELEELKSYYSIRKITKGLLKNWIESDITISTHHSTAYAGYLLANRTVPLYHMQGFEEAFINDENSKLIARSTYNFPLINISNSKWLQNIMWKYYNKKSYLLNPGIDYSLFKPFENIEKKYVEKKDWLIVSYIDEKWKLKGFNDAVKAVKIARDHLSKKGIKLHWKVFGYNGPSRKYETEFEYVGPMFGEDLAKLYSSADIILFTSWHESFPLPPIEAMACGSLIITTKYGTEDYVFHKKNGLVCLPREIKDIANNIIYGVLNAEDSYQMVKKGLETVKIFNWENQTDLLEKILNKSINGYSYDKYKISDYLISGEFDENIHDKLIIDSLLTKKMI